ncbi:MAG: polA [Parcubacteria group bacterium]|nr:polA [Parcubacteria group bacterium]
MKVKPDIQRLVLLDAHAIIHRAFHALPDFATSQGEPTGALFGVVTMLTKIIEELAPDSIVACYDLPEKTHRHEAYEEYKGTRRALDPNLVLQLERSKDIFRAWNIPIYSCPGFEADDILGTIVEDLKKDKAIEIVIASGDMDTLQLVDGKKVRVYTLKKGIKDTILYDEKAVFERFGFGPLLLPDFKGLRGDPSDNIIGVKGIGEKTATSLITAFGTIEKIYKALKKKDEYKKAGITERIKDLLLENEEEALFSKTLATIRRDAPINFTMPAPWKETLVMENLLELFKTLEFRTMGERIKNLLASKKDDKAKIPKDKKSPKIKKETPAPVELSKGDKELLLMLWIVDSNFTLPTLEDVFAFTKTEDKKEARAILEAELDKRKVRSVYEEIEKPLMPVTERMNARGVVVDKDELKKLSVTYHKELSRLEGEIWKHAGEEFNINSPKQLGEILFTKLDLGEKRQKKTATGGFSTKESELDKLADKHPIIGCILDYRELSKLLGTYIDTIPLLLDAESRLHSTFTQEGTTTGRMASNDPNLQNIPIKTPLGRAIRHAFVAPNGFVLLSLDYSQIELRIAAILSKDKKLIDIFKKGEDVHTGVAMRVFGVKAEEVDKAMRTKAKTINFGVLFGMGVNALKTNLKTDRKEAQEFYNNYFNTFSELAAYLGQVKAEAERKGYTETLYGRRRYFAGLKSPLPFIRAAAERMAINAPIQGTEADIVKIAMKRIDDRIYTKGWEDQAFPVLNVHDEIVYEVKKEIAEEAQREFKKIMEEVIPEEKTLGVPIVAEGKTASNWGDI